MNNQGIDASVRRKVDFRFLTGAGNYTEDINRAGGDGDDQGPSGGEGLQTASRHLRPRMLIKD